MKLVVASDHGGVPLNEEVIEELRRLGHDVVDLGTHDANNGDDYPDYAEALGRKVASGECERGVLICGSGVGATVAANKVHGVRAGLCHDTYSAHQGVEHDNCNVLCLGARVIGRELALDLVRTFIGARFTNEPRHKRRLEKVLAIERKG
jgi:ribose 5-phosphate isomerase B